MRNIFLLSVLLTKFISTVNRSFLSSMIPAAWITKSIGPTFLMKSSYARSISGFLVISILQNVMFATPSSFNLDGFSLWSKIPRFYGQLWSDDGLHLIYKDETIPLFWTAKDICKLRIRFHQIHRRQPLSYQPHPFLLWKCYNKRLWSLGFIDTWNHRSWHIYLFARLKFVSLSLSFRVAASWMWLHYK